MAITNLTGCSWKGIKENLTFNNAGKFYLNFNYNGKNYSSIQITSKGLKFDDELVAGEEEQNMPVKGQIINLNMDGTTRQYRVLKTNGNQAEVVAMFDPNTSCPFNGTGSNVYNGGELDVYLNTTWYGGLTTTAKNALVSKTLTQYQYSYNSGVYSANTHASYADYSTKSVKATGLSRKVYALDVEDIEDYFNHTFSTADIWELFWNVRSRPSSVTYPWTRSADADDSNPAWCVNGNNGRVRNYGAGSNFAARPAFTIDLSKISWS